MFGTLTPRTSRLPRFMEWNPFEMMERVFEEPKEWWPLAEKFAPPVNISETPTTFEVSIELPGLKPEEVKVELSEGRLFITGEKKEEKEEKGKTFHRVERRHGEFRRVLTMPAAVNPENVVAKFENGLLTVTLAKKEEVRPKTIEVKT